MGLAYDDCKINVSIAVWYWGEYVGQGTLEERQPGQDLELCRASTSIPTCRRPRRAATTCCSRWRAPKRSATAMTKRYLLDATGHVAEGSVEHIFLVRDGALVTPPLTHLLDGITRDAVITLARERNIEVREELFSRDYMLTADEAFFAGTGAEVTPVVEIDRRKIGDGKRGPLTTADPGGFFDAVYGRHQRMGRMAHLRVNDRQGAAMAPLPPDEYANRLTRARASDAERGMDGLIVTDPVHYTYFTRSQGSVLDAVPALDLRVRPRWRTHADQLVGSRHVRPALQAAVSVVGSRTAASIRRCRSTASPASTGASPRFSPRRGLRQARSGSSSDARPGSASRWSISSFSRNRCRR